MYLDSLILLECFAVLSFKSLRYLLFTDHHMCLHLSVNVNNVTANKGILSHYSTEFYSACHVHTSFTPEPKTTFIQLPQGRLIACTSNWKMENAFELLKQRMHTESGIPSQFHHIFY